ncbi:MAG: ABC transporter permease [Lachnospiraceae bacterium]|nr:ABC transporter permease [Lachnospiraceae bacterium]
MKLLKLELKRVLKTRLTWILLLCNLFFTFFMAYMPTTFHSITYTDEMGETVKLKGLDSIKYRKEIQKDTAGIVTPEKLRQALEVFQDCLNEYGAASIYELHEDVYNERILPYAPLWRCMREAYANPDTGMAANITDIDPQQIDNFYSACLDRISSLMKMEQKNHPAAQNHAITMYDKVEMPFTFYPGYTTEAMDYQTMFIFLIVLFSVVITAPIFSSDYQSGADDIIRCTKNGRLRLGITKIVSSIIICMSSFVLCNILYILVSNSLFGWECTKISIQMLYSVVSLPSFNLGEMQFFIVLASLISMLATISLTLFISSKCKTNFASLSIGILFFFLPIVVYASIPGNIGTWLLCILPSSGTSIQSAYQFVLTDFEYLNIGNIAVWTPYAMIGFTVIELVVFTGLILHSYCAHKIK